MEQKKSLLYIGNKLSNKGNTTTSIETLGNFLKRAGYSVITSSSKKPKALRLMDMLKTTFINRNRVSVVLIDTYSTQNFYYAYAVASLCRMLKIPYVPILRGGNLPHRLEKSKRASQKLFNSAKMNVAPSQYILKEFKNLHIKISHINILFPSSPTASRGTGEFPLACILCNSTAFLWLEAYYSYFNFYLLMTLSRFSHLKLTHHKITHFYSVEHWLSGINLNNRN